MNDSLTQPDRYDRVARAFHWTMALLIFYAALSILIAEELPRGDFRTFLSTSHRTIGAVVIVLLLFRVVWRIFHKPPPLPTQMTPFQQRMAHIGHFGLYALMALVPIIGVALTFRRGGTINFGFFDIASPFIADRESAKPIKEVHELLAFVLLGLVGVHVAAAIWHQIVKRDDIMARMK
jgi:cytochrome b561